MARLLIVDDEVKLLRLLRALFDEQGHQVVTATRAEEAEALLAARSFDLLITDVRLPRRSGIELFRTARRLHPELQVIVMSAYGTVSGAVEAMRLGAFDYLLKPFELEGLRLVAERALDTARMRRENRYLRSQATDAQPGRSLVARSPTMEQVVEMVDKVAATTTTVLLLGESGAGKELVAETIHGRSPRGERPLIRVNCPAIPRDLLESELFGHVRGAFTGAEVSRTGKFELADGSTLFLDEIGDLPPSQQGKLLNVLETRSFSRVGSGDVIAVDVRVLAATNRDLSQLVAEGSFRADLFYRLNVFPIAVPPLRERGADLPELVRQLLLRLGHRLGNPDLRISPQVLPSLQRYAWPGNVRELRNVLERAAVLAGRDEITEADLPSEILSDRAPAPQGGHEDQGLNASLESYKIQLLLDALQAAGWKKKRAAEQLGLSPRALSHYIQRYDLERFRVAGEPA